MRDPLGADRRAPVRGKRYGIRVYLPLRVEIDVAGEGHGISGSIRLSLAVGLCVPADEVITCTRKPARGGCERATLVDIVRRRHRAVPAVRRVEQPVGSNTADARLRLFVKDVIFDGRFLRGNVAILAGILMLRPVRSGHVVELVFVPTGLDVRPGEPTLVHALCGEGRSLRSLGHLAIIDLRRGIEDKRAWMVLNVIFVPICSMPDCLRPERLRAREWVPLIVHDICLRRNHRACGYLYGEPMVVAATTDASGALAANCLHDGSATDGNVAIAIVYVIISRAIARPDTSACATSDGCDIPSRDAYVATPIALLWAAYAGTAIATRRCDGTALDGYVVRVVVVAANARATIPTRSLHRSAPYGYGPRMALTTRKTIISTTDAFRMHAATRRDLGVGPADGNRSTVTAPSRSKARSSRTGTLAPSDGHDSAARDVDDSSVITTVIATIAVSDASAATSTRGIDLSARDGDVPTFSITGTSTDTCRRAATCGPQDSPMDGNDAAVRTMLCVIAIRSADTSTAIRGRGVDVASVHGECAAISVRPRTDAGTNGPNGLNHASKYRDLAAIAVPAAPDTGRVAQIVSLPVLLALGMHLATVYGHGAEVLVWTSTYGSRIRISMLISREGLKHT